MPASRPESRALPLILIIDDDPISREVTATLLTLSGYAVETVGNGDAALLRLNDLDAPPALILADAQMPGLHGHELILQLRARTQSPVAVISGSQPDEAMARAADAVLLKPFGPEAVRQLLNELASRSPLLARQSAAGSSDRPIIRPEILAQFRSLMSEAAVLQVYNAIVADLGRRATALEAALAANNGDEIRRIGHAVKGGCAMAGAAQAAWLGEQLEAGHFAADGNQLDDCRHLPAELRAAAENLQRMLEGEFLVKGQVERG